MAIRGFERLAGTIGELRRSGDPLRAILQRLSDERPETLAHSQRVAANARMIAEGAGFTDDRVRNIENAALLHDVGKILVPNEIFYSSGALSGPELQEMQMHAAYGEALLRPFVTDKVVLDVANCHHESYRGDGYLAMSSENIPVEARIVAIADVYDALTSARTYKKGMTAEQALLAMTSADHGARTCRSQFDPYYLRVFVTQFMERDAAPLSDSARSELTRFVMSDPMQDFLPGHLPDGLQIDRDGSRRLFEIDGSGKERVVFEAAGDGSTWDGRDDAFGERRALSA